MSKTLANLFKAAPAAFGISFVVAQSAIASPSNDPQAISQPLPEAATEFNLSGSQNFVAQAVPAPAATANPNNAEILNLMQRSRESKRFNSQSGEPMSQVTSVSELRDVSPTDWAYEALRSLVERYGCIVGYPDRTYRGDRALTRWEFAAGLNACMNVLERLIQENVAVLKEDIDKLKRLAQEFEAELAALGARVDNLEARVSFLEDHQFSTTTKLRGTVIFAIGDAWTDGSNKASTSGSPPNTASFDTRPFFSDRVRLNFNTSFTGKDLLRTRIQAGSTFNLAGNTGTDMARLNFDVSNPTNAAFIDDLFYRFPVGNFTFWIGANGLNLDDVFNTVNPFMESSDIGSLSREQRYNPLVYRAPDGTGAAAKYKFSDSFSVTATYLALQGSANVPQPGKGLFNGAYSAGAQLDWKPDKALDLAFTYLHSYEPFNNVNVVGSTGSSITKNPFGGAATSADRFGLQGNWRISSWLNLSAWGGYASANGESEDRRGVDRQGDSADIWTWNAALSFPDLGTQGAVLTLSGGQTPVAPYVEGSARDTGTGYIIEAQYRYPITDNISLTPGAWVIINPNNDDSNSNIWVGVLRGVFQF